MSDSRQPSKNFERKTDGSRKPEVAAGGGSSDGVDNSNETSYRKKTVKQYDNSNSNFKSNDNYDNDTNSGPVPRYNSNRGQSNRGYDNGNDGRRYDNGNDGRRYDNGNDGRRYDNRSYDNGNDGRRYDNRNQGSRNYDNEEYSNTSNSGRGGGGRGRGNRGYDNRGYDNRGQGSRGYDNRNGENRNYDNRNGGNGGNGDRRNDPEYIEESTKEDKETSSSAPVAETSTEPKPLTEEEIAKREECMIPITSFDELSTLIDLKIIRGVMAYGFDSPSPIQQKAIKPFLSKYDVIAQAQSGTGKTATFCIGTLGNIDVTKNETQAIILAHTMELAQQIEHVFSNIGKYLDVRLGLAVKTLSVRENIDALLGRNNDGNLPHVVIGTPGRMLDMITKKIINIDTVRIIILDEADELLSEGFMIQIKQILSSISLDTQIGLFSATMDSNFFKMTQKFMRNPINILIEKENLTLSGIKQYNIDCEKNEYKFDTLCDLYSLISTSQTIIYCNYHQSVELLTKKMQEQNFKVSLIHGSMDISEREEAMRKFRSLQTRVLISTDLLGRGIDVQQVSIVINYDIPFKNESYIHRIGRSGRHGRTGTAINFVTNNDVRRIDEIAKYYSTTICPLPADLATVFQTNN